jgi:hypothetical protein
VSQGVESSAVRERDEIAPVLEEVRGRFRLVRALESGLRAGAVLVGGTVVLAALDNLLHLGAGARVALGLGLLGTLAAAAARSLLRRTPDRLEAAILLERANPSLENRLVNAERLARESGTPPLVLEVLRTEARTVLAGFDPREVLPLRRLRPLATTALVCLAALAVYAAVAPRYLANALARYARPTRFTPPITRTTLAVSPGDVTVVEGETVTVRASVGGAIPTGARVRTGSSSADMRFLGGDFLYEWRNVTAPFDYSVAAGDAESDTFHVQVLRPARIAKLTAKYDYPDYLGLAPRVEDPASGNVSAVEGTRVTITIEMTKPLERLEVVSDVALPAVESSLLCFVLSKSGSYRLAWRDKDGLDGKSAPFTLRAIQDRPPVVKLLEPARDASVRPNGELAALVLATDDFGLASLELRASKGGKEPARLAELDVAPETSDAAPRREVRASRRLSIQELGVRPGETVALVAVARDRKGQESSSNVVQLRVLDEAQAKAALLRELASLVARLRKVVAVQRRLRDETLRAPVGTPALVQAQRAIEDELVAIHATWNDPDLRHVRARARLEAAIQGPATRAVEDVRRDPKAGAETQAALVTELEAVIAELEGLAAALRAGDAEKALAQAADRSPRDAAKDLLAGLKDFVAEQKKAIEATQAVKPRTGEDFTDAQKKELEALRQTEEKWGKYLAEKATDLSKVPPQDFSNGNTVKDLEAAASEVKQAGDELAKKATTLAVPLEQSGLELAKEITENIERWLADGRDTAKWVMEEPKGAADVPMADLPSALEDLVGDLLDKEDKLAEDAQDVTSSWMDSMDKGIGWSAADGPMSNMSAKGITGNQQPNSQEIAGRSGEGRSGKSSGQMVGDSAVGKGGKQTPTRSTPDAFEAGRVKDKSKDPSGGSTGGGKIGGANKEGLRGVPPPPIQGKMERLADRQADIRNTAEKVKVALGRRGYVSEDLARALERMKRLESELRAHRGAEMTGDARAIAEELGAVKRAVRDELEVTRDPARGSRSTREELLSARDEPIPADYQDLVREYYKALSER